jgi:predicted Zn-dependent peptidase
LALDVLSDMLFNSKFEGEEIEREKGVISEEIRMYEDNPLMYIEDLFEQTMFRGHPLGQRVSGKVEMVKKITRKEMLDYKNNYYTPRNAVLAVAGKFEKKEINLIKKYFGERGGKAKTSFVRFKTGLKKPCFQLQFKETEQIQFALGFPGYSYFDPKIYALNLLSVILGGTMSSRLFIAIRERKGLCYFIKSFLNIYEDTGNLVIQSGLDKSRIELAIQAILLELDKIRKNSIDPAELRRAKDCIKGRLILGLEDSSHVADWYAEQELLTKRILTPEEKLKKIFAVEAADIRKVAQEVIQNKKLCAALIGPFKDERPFTKLLKI